MAKKDPRIDAYIAKSAAFAQPILRHLRQLVHQACPEVVETLKWGHPAFDYEGILCGMAAFKEHVTFGFWKHALVLGQAGERTAMGSFGCITQVSDLPAKSVLTRYVKKAMALNEDGITVERVVKKRAPIAMPAGFAKALAKNRKAKAAYEEFSPSCQREYLEWIVEAKREATREQRIATAIEWIAAGKRRNWKYEKC